QRVIGTGAFGSRCRGRFRPKQGVRVFGRGSTLLARPGDAPGPRGLGLRLGHEKYENKAEGKKTDNRRKSIHSANDCIAGEGQVESPDPRCSSNRRSDAAKPRGVRLRK